MGLQRPEELAHPDQAGVAHDRVGRREAGDVHGRPGYGGDSSSPPPSHGRAPAAETGVGVRGPRGAVSADAPPFVASAARSIVASTSVRLSAFCFRARNRACARCRPSIRSSRAARWCVWLGCAAAWAELVLGGLYQVLEPRQRQRRRELLDRELSFRRRQDGQPRQDRLAQRHTRDRDGRDLARPEPRPAAHALDGCP